MAGSGHHIQTDASPDDGTQAAGPSHCRRGRSQAPQNVNISHVGITESVVKVSNIKADKVTANGPIVILSPAYQMQHFPEPNDPYDEALRPPKPPEDLSVLFSEEELDLEVEQKHFVPIAMSFDVNTNWRWFARKLQVDSALFNHLCMMHTHNIPELVYQMLMFWKRNNPMKTLRAMVWALCDSRNPSAVRSLREFFDRQGEEEEEK